MTYKIRTTAERQASILRMMPMGPHEMEQWMSIERSHDATKLLQSLRLTRFRSAPIHGKIDYAALDRRNAEDRRIVKLVGYLVKRMEREDAK